MNDPEHIENDEELYRRFESNKFNTKTPLHYIVKASGDIKLQSAAFLGGERPSVDRSKLRSKPEETKKNDSDGILSVITEDVRSISIRDFTVDVKYEPINDNKAHSEIIIIPNLDGISNSRKKGGLSDLRRGLADIAVCKIKPNPV